MTSKIIVNTIEADTGISSVTFASNINLANDSSILVSSSGIRLGTGSTIAAPSANELALSTNSAERFRITSGGLVGIGTDNPDNYNPNADDLVIFGTGHQGLTIRSGTSHDGSIMFNDTDNANQRGIIRYLHTDDSMAFHTSGGEALRIDSSGFIKQKFTSNNSTTAEGLFINNLNNGTGNNASLILSNDSGERKKAAIALIDTGNYGAGDLVFALDGADSGELHLTNDEKLRIGSGGNLALGGQNTSGYSGHTNFFIGGIANLYAETTAASGGSLSISNNAYINSSGNWVYRVGGKASNSYQYDGGYGFRTAGTGSAGGTISWTERFSITNAGSVTTPNQPGFFARRSIAGDGRAAQAQEWTVTGTGSFNTGSHFNTSNGRFTAPVAGRYIFTAAPGYKQTSYDYNFKFLINGGQQSEPVRIIDGGDDLTSHSGFTGTVIYNLNANDYVQVEVGYIHHVNLTYNFFMGYLLG